MSILSGKVYENIYEINKINTKIYLRNLIHYDIFQDFNKIYDYIKSEYNNNIDIFVRDFYNIFKDLDYVLNSFVLYIITNKFNLPLEKLLKLTTFNVNYISILSVLYYQIPTQKKDGQITSGKPLILTEITPQQAEELATEIAAEKKLKIKLANPTNLAIEAAEPSDPSAAKPEAESAEVESTPSTKPEASVSEPDILKVPLIDYIFNPESYNILDVKATGTNLDEIKQQYIKVLNDKRNVYYMTNNILTKNKGLTLKDWYKLKSDTDNTNNGSKENIITWITNNIINKEDNIRYVKNRISSIPIENVEIDKDLKITDKLNYGKFKINSNQVVIQHTYKPNLKLSDYISKEEFKNHIISTLNKIIYKLLSDFFIFDLSEIKNRNDIINIIELYTDRLKIDINDFLET